VPVYLSLAAWCQSGEASLLQHWAKWWYEKRKETATPMEVEDWASLAREWLRTGKVVLLLDGLDEVDTGQRPWLKARLSEIAGDPGYSRCPLIVTTRFAGYTPGELGGRFQEAEILPLEPRQAERYLRTVLAEHPHRVSDLMRELQGNVRLRILTGNPLLLEIAALAFLEKQFQLPSDLVDFYDRAVQALLLRALREAPRGPTGASVPSESLLRRALEKIAWESFREDHHVVDESVILKELAASFGGSEAPTVADEVLRSLREQSRLLVRLSDGRYQLLHLTFLEYLAACELNRQTMKKKLDYVDRACWLPRWEEVLRFLASMQPDPEPIVRTLLNARDDLHARRAWTASRCLEVAKRTRRWTELVREIDDALFERWGGNPSDVAEVLTAHPRLQEALPHRYVGRSLGAPKGRPSRSRTSSQSESRGDGVTGALTRNLIRLVQREHVDSGAIALHAGTTNREALKALVGMVRHGDQLAAVALTGTTDSESLKDLVGLTQDRDWRIRQTAATALRETTDPEALRALVRLAGDHEDEVASEATLALTGTTNPEVVKAIVWAKGKATEALVGTTDRAVIDALVTLTQDEQAWVRFPAVWALTGTSDPEAVKALVRLTQDKDYWVQRAAAEALTGTSDPEAVRALVRLTSDCGEPAAKALTGTSDPEAVKCLVRLTQDKDHPFARLAAAQALTGTSDPEAVRALVRLTQDKYYWVQRAAAEALTGTSDLEAVRALVRLMRSDAKDEAAKALIGTIERDAIAALVRLTQDELSGVRQAAAVALTGTHDREAIAALVHLTQDGNALECGAAAMALIGAPDPAAIAALLVFTRESVMFGLPGCEDRGFRSALAWILSINLPAAREALRVFSRQLGGHGATVATCQPYLPLWPTDIVLWPDLSVQPRQAVAGGLD
jgi:HEAT repeat protein